ncbi:biotin--[acetyl-CoA-carboxylase] ligase [Blattabacterium cuenoti]|uniref:biotin--[acetyl-CoA-carboxylase] ligase n=1 Tax=Blattabacterium cuenoti TaxID=1653831 RepID=UPI00163CE2F3|nr:biotin--[acetyl-CoA-carboxylase] ligase [Blattabacterium cuenoti]
MIKFIWPIDLILLKEVDSTNKYARKYVYKKKNWIIISSINQTKGIGMGKNQWYTEKGKNLTFSIIFKPIKILPVKKRYIINIITSNAIHKTLLNYNNNNLIWIKWPNDIIYDNKKIGGILIENNIFLQNVHSIIVGIGLNINQTKFNKKWNVSSLKKIFNINFKLDKLFFEIIYSFQKEYFLFITYGENFIRNYYINHLYLKDKNSLFYVYKTKSYTKGIIRSITDQGFLIIEIKKKLYFFFQKEIKLILS